MAFFENIFSGIGDELNKLRDQFNVKPLTPTAQKPVAPTPYQEPVQAPTPTTQVGSSGGFMSNTLDIIQGLPTTKEEVKSYQNALKSIPSVNKAARNEATLSWAKANAEKKAREETFEQKRQRQIAALPSGVQQTEFKKYEAPTFETPAQKMDYTSRLKAMESEIADYERDKRFENAWKSFENIGMSRVNMGAGGGLGELKGFAGGAVAGAVGISKMPFQLGTWLNEMDESEGILPSVSNFLKGAVAAPLNIATLGQFTDIERNKAAVDAISGFQKDIVDVTTDSGRQGAFGALFGQGFGDIAPTMATSFAAGPRLALALQAAQAGGETYEEARESGMDVTGAGLTSIVSAGINRLTASVGSIPQLNKLATTTLGKGVVNNFVREATEEVADQYLQNILAAKTFDPHRNVTSGLLEAGLVGGVVGAGVTGAAKIAQQAGFKIPDKKEIEQQSYDALVAKGVNKNVASIISGKVGTNVVDGIKARMDSPEFLEALRPDKFTSGPDIGKLFEAEKAYQAGKQKVDPLITEAKKYKSAKEFIDNFSLFHGTAAKIKDGKLKFGAGDIKKGGTAGGHFLSDDAGISKAFSFGGETYRVSSKYKNEVLDLRKPQTVNLFKNQIGKEYEIDEGFGKESVVFTQQDFDSMFPDGEADYASINIDIAKSVANQQGKVGVAFNETADNKTGTTYQLFQDDIPVYTKKQLTDIYNKARGKPKVDVKKVAPKKAPVKKPKIGISKVKKAAPKVEPLISKKNIAEVYKERTNYDSAVMETIAEMETSQAGKRLFIDGEVSGVKSTFPDWVPSNLRDSKLFNKVLSELDFDNPVYPKAANIRQKDLVDAILDQLDKKMGVDTSAERVALEEKSKAYWADKRNVKKEAARQKAIEARRVKAKQKAEARAAEEKKTKAEREKVAAGIDERLQKYINMTLGYTIKAPEATGKKSLLEKVKTPITAPQKAVAKKVTQLSEFTQRKLEQAVKSENKALRSLANLIGGHFKTAIVSPERASKAMKYRGEMANADRRAYLIADRAYDVLDGNKKSLEKINAVLDPELAKKKVSIKDLSSKEKAVHDMLRMGFDLVHDISFANGHISKELWDANKGKYMPRLYDTHELPEKLQEAIKYSKQRGVESKIYKKKGEVDDWKVERNLNDPIYSFAKRLAQVETNRAIKGYSDFLIESGNVADVEKKGWSQMPDSKSYGDLAGKWVPQNVAEDFEGFFFQNNILNSFYDMAKAYDRIPLRQIQKKYLTVMNPLTHLGNITSNNVFAFLAGVNPVSVTKNIKYLTSKKNKVERARLEDYLTREGILGTDITRADLQQKLVDIDELAMREEGIEPTALKKTQRALAEGEAGVTSFYGGTDDMYKMATFKSLLDKGYSLADATKAIDDGFQNYAKVGKYYDLYAKTPLVGSAFVKFKGDFLRILKNAAVNRPLALAGFLSGLSAVGQMLSQMSGESEEEYKLRTQRLGASVIPGLNIPLNWKIPGTDTDFNAARYIFPLYTSQYENLDAGRSMFGEFVPYGGLVDFLIDSKKSKDQMGALAGLFNDPFLGGVVQTLIDRDFRGKPTSDKDISSYETSTLSPEEQLYNRFMFLLRAYTPPAISNITDAVSTATGGEDFYGRTRSGPETVARMAGLRVETFGKEQYREQRIKNAEHIERTEKFVQGQIHIVVKDKMAGEITKEQAADRIGQYKDDVEFNVMQYANEYAVEQKETQEKRQVKIDAVRSDQNRLNEIRNVIRKGREAGYTNSMIYDKIKPLDDSLRAKGSQPMTQYIFTDIYDELVEMENK